MALINAGWTYKFSFATPFDPLDGIYTIAKIYSWNELLNEKLSLYDLLYQPLNIPAEQYNSEVNTYRQENIYKLVSPTTGKAQYVPEALLQTRPIYTVKEYPNLTMMIPLGTYADETGLSYLTTVVGDQIRSILGIRKEPAIVMTGKVYLTKEEYGEIAAIRDKLTTNTNNTYTSLCEANEEITRLRGMVAGYQHILQTKLGGK